MERSNLVLVRRFVDAMDRWSFLFEQVTRHCLVGGQHELFDHFMCIVVFGLDNSFHLPFGVHVNFRFGYLEIDASRLKPALSQNPAELVHLF